MWWHHGGALRRRQLSLLASHVAFLSTAFPGFCQMKLCTHCITGKGWNLKCQYEQALKINCFLFTASDFWSGKINPELTAMERRFQIRVKHPGVPCWLQRLFLILWQRPSMHSYCRQTSNEGITIADSLCQSGVAKGSQCFLQHGPWASHVILGLWKRVNSFLHLCRLSEGCCWCAFPLPTNYH